MSLGQTSRCRPQWGTCPAARAGSPRRCRAQGPATGSRRTCLEAPTRTAPCRSPLPSQDSRPLASPPLGGTAAARAPGLSATCTGSSCSRRARALLATKRLGSPRSSCTARQAWAGTLDALTSALSARDSDTQTHCYRTVELAVALAREMQLPTEEVAAIARGALLHDIGKIGISDTILLKPGELSCDERTEIQRHSRLGHDMLQHIPFFADALPIVLYHHECYDGSGYPDGLCGEAIPRGARIFHVVDLYDALTQERPYKARLEPRCRDARTAPLVRHALRSQSRGRAVRARRRRI